LGIIATTIVATLATAPFSVMFFNRFAVYSIIANIGAMPLMAFIVMPFGLLGTILIPTGLDSYVWPVMAWGIAKIVHIAHHVAAYDGADLYLPSFGALETILITAGFLWVILWRGHYRWAGVFFVCLALLLPFATTRPMIFISERMEVILIVDKSRDNIYEWGKMNGYLRLNWLASLGLKPSVDILSYRKGDNAPHTLGLCDDYYCLFKMEGHKIAMTDHPLSLRNACENSDILIATFPVSKGICKGPYIIDRFDIWREGPTSITFTKERYKVTSVNDN
jgi:competence protein ComEC